MKSATELAEALSDWLNEVDPAEGQPWGYDDLLPGQKAAWTRKCNALHAACEREGLDPQAVMAAVEWDGS